MFRVISTSNNSSHQRNGDTSPKVCMYLVPHHWIRWQCQGVKLDRAVVFSFGVPECLGGTSELFLRGLWKVVWIRQTHDNRLKCARKEPEVPLENAVGSADWKRLEPWGYTICSDLGACWSTGPHYLLCHSFSGTGLTPHSYQWVSQGPPPTKTISDPGERRYCPNCIQKFCLSSPSYVSPHSVGWLGSRWCVRECHGTSQLQDWASEELQQYRIGESNISWPSYIPMYVNRETSYWVSIKISAAFSSRRGLRCLLVWK